MENTKLSFENHVSHEPYDLESLSLSLSFLAYKILLFC